MQINIMALRHSAFYSPLLLTMSGGYLEEQGLEYSYALQTADNTVVDRLNDGKCHLAQSAVATSFAELESGQIPEIVHFAKINERDGFFVAARQSMNPFDWQQLRGKKVLVDHFFQPYAMLKYGLHQQGISFDDFTVVDAGDVDQIDQSFRGGMADFIHQQGPAPQQLQHDGFVQCFGAVGDLVGPVAFSSLCATRSWLESDMAKHFMHAYSRASEAVMTMEAAAIAELHLKAGFFPDIDKSVLVETIRAYQALGCWSAEPHISLESYERLLDVFLHAGAITKRYPYNAAIVAPPL